MWESLRSLGLMTGVEAEQPMELLIGQLIQGEPVIPQQLPQPPLPTHLRTGELMFCRVESSLLTQTILIGNLSLAHPLGFGNPEQVSEASRALIRQMAPGGGYCFSSGNSIPDYIPYENWLAMRNTALEAGVYPIH